MNIQIFFIAIIYGITKIGYFGWNYESISDAEMICNGIMFLILALAFKDK